MNDRSLPLSQLREEIDRYIFRHIHPRLRFGTASDRYGGWIGQIYSEHWQDKVVRRAKKLNGETFKEPVLPVETVREYFEHFNILELDFTFYRPLLNSDASPTSNYFALRQYLRYAPPDALFLLKAPQIFFTRKLRRSTKGQVAYEENPDYLNAERYLKEFHQPAQELLQEHLVGIIFEQAYQRVSDTPPVDEVIEDFDQFFRQLPPVPQSHIELRSPHLLQPPLFNWMASQGIGYVFSHWTYLPPLHKQWKLCGERFTARNREAVVRLMTPLRMTYAEAYARAFPFDKPVPELANTPQAQRMIEDTVELAFYAIEQEVTLNIIANNRAYGNAPELARAIALRFIERWTQQANLTG